MPVRDIDGRTILTGGYLWACDCGAISEPAAEIGRVQEDAMKHAQPLAHAMPVICYRCCRCDTYLPVDLAGPHEAGCTLGAALRARGESP